MRFEVGSLSVFYKAMARELESLVGRAVIFLYLLLVFIPIASDAHVITVGSYKTSPTSAQFWFGSYHATSEAPPVQGTLNVTGPDGYNQTFTFSVQVGSRPSGLIDNVNNFLSGYNGHNSFGDVQSWEGVTITGMKPGTYNYTYIRDSSSSAKWETGSITTGSIIIPPSCDDVPLDCLCRQRSNEVKIFDSGTNANTKVECCNSPCAGLLDSSGTFTNSTLAAAGCYPAPSVCPTPNPPPSNELNSHLDYGTQGALPRFNSKNTGHKFMPPKNTPAESLVDKFRWLYANVRPQAQYSLYRGTGFNGGADVINPMNLFPDEGESSPPKAVLKLAPTNIEDENPADNGAYVMENALNSGKCYRIHFNGCGLAPDIGKQLASAVSSGSEDDMAGPSALYTRLQYDSCTNQIILPMTLNTNFVMNDDLRDNDSAYNESWCQPFLMKPVDCFRNRLIPISKCLPDEGERDGHMYDYRAWGYLRLAWEGVLQQPYTPSGGTGVYTWLGNDLTIPVGEAPYVSDGGLNLNELLSFVLSVTPAGALEMRGNGPDVNKQMKIDGAKKLGGPMNVVASMFPGGMVGPTGVLTNATVGLITGGYTGNLTMINDLAVQPYERIWDPTHPYSPRWDFKGTDRSFSTMLARVSDPPTEGMGFSTSWSNCIVRCAAVPVDVLSFRMLSFTACISCRIAINSAVFWEQVQYLTQTITIDFGIVGARCRGLSQDAAISRTAEDRVLGPFFGAGYATQLTLSIPPVFHGRIKMNAGESGYIRIMGITINIPSSLMGGCHYMMCPICFVKSNNHNTHNPDDYLGTKLGPQPKVFDSLWPICSTKYEYTDATLNVPQCMSCTMLSGDINMFNGIRECCDDLAHALAPINTLKIRNTVFSPGLEPTPEGYKFNEYFSHNDPKSAEPGNPQRTPAEAHMPYMRWWDTGKSAGGSASWVGVDDYDPDSNCGQYDSIVGVGTEDWNGDSAGGNRAKYCRYGGNGYEVDGDTGIPYSTEAIRALEDLTGGTIDINKALNSWTGVDFTKFGIPPFYHCIRLRTVNTANVQTNSVALGPDAMTSWDELKMYQARSILRGLNCLPQYEKMHKPFGSEEFTLGASGGSMMVPRLLNRSMGNDKDALDPAKGPNKGFYQVPYQGASPANPPAAANVNNAPGDLMPNSILGNSFEMVSVPWPLSWRGYVSDPDCDNAFPYFKGDGTSWSAQSLGADALLVFPCGNNIGGTEKGYSIPGAKSPLGNAPLIVDSGGKNTIGFAHVPSWPELWPLMPGGLDNVKIGDMVYLNHEDIDYALAVSYVNWMSGEDVYFSGTMPYAALVKGVHTTWLDSTGKVRLPEATDSDCQKTGEKNCFTTCQSYVQLDEVNNGKVPDVCGNTDMYGHGQSRTIYKEWLPEDVMDTVFGASVTVINSCGNVYTTKPSKYSIDPGDAAADASQYEFNNFGSCADPKMASCTFADLSFGSSSGNNAVNLWNHFRIYRPIWDYRQ